MGGHDEILKAGVISVCWSVQLKSFPLIEVLIKHPLNCVLLNAPQEFGEERFGASWPGISLLGDTSVRSLAALGTLPW